MAINLEHICRSLADHLDVGLEEMRWTEFFDRYVRHHNEYGDTPDFIFEIEALAGAREHGQYEGGFLSELCLAGRHAAAQVYYVRLADAAHSSECAYIETPAVTIEIKRGMNHHDSGSLHVTDKTVPGALNMLISNDRHRRPHPYLVFLSSIEHEHGDEAYPMLLMTLAHLVRPSGE